MPDNKIEIIKKLLRNNNFKLSLYEGVESYKKKYQEKLDDYKQLLSKYSLIPKDAAEFHSFREAFNNFLEASDEILDEKTLAGEKQASPEKFTTKLTDFLGEDGAQLYSLALEEEAYSEKYRNSCLEGSLNLYGGLQWDVQPNLVVAGPSGSGKSFSANNVIKRYKNARQLSAATVAKFSAMLKNETSLPPLSKSNATISVDGGIMRARSVTRNSVLRKAVDNGFTGIADLHALSSVIGKPIKQSIYNAASCAKDTGVVIPETFSKWLLVTRKNYPKKLTNLAKKEKSKFIFSRVVGLYPDKFKDVVAFMGKSRAWNTTVGADAKLQESKIYDGRGFGFGARGSKRAESYSQKNFSDESLVIINDLILLKKDKLNEWVPANSDDKNVLLVSDRAYKYWQKNSAGALEEFWDDVKNSKAEISLKPIIISQKKYRILKELPQDIFADLDFTKDSADIINDLQEIEQNVTKNRSHSFFGNRKVAGVIKKLVDIDSQNQSFKAPNSP